jgi:drug/metabolite transporter (DMT)-like permease
VDSDWNADGMHRAGLLRLSGLALIWGSGFLWIKLSLNGFVPVHIVLIRLALGAAVLTAWLYAHGGRLPSSPKLWAHLTFAATMANVAPYLLVAAGERQVDSAVAGMLNATTPLWTVVLAVLTGQERRPDRAKLAGFMLGLAGTLLIFAPWRAGSQFTSAGALACLAAAACYALSFVYMDRFLARRGLAPLTLSAGQLLAAAAVTAVMTPVFGGLRIPAWNPGAIASVLVLGTLGTGVAYVLNYRIITDDGASAASMVIYLLPVVAVILGAAFLHERPTVHAIAGMAVVLGGVALTKRRR